MSERDDRPVAEETRDDQQAELQKDLVEGASPGQIGALDGAAAAGSLGAVGEPEVDSDLPTGAPDPSIGPD